MNALAQLDHAVNFGLEELTRLRVSGIVTEVTPSYYRLAGLSHFLKLGECVGINHGGATQLAEVVRIDAGGHDRQDFRSAGCSRPRRSAPIALDALHVAPDVSWKGRVIDALGRPIDASGALRRGEHALPIEAQPPAALRRARVKAPVKTGVRVIDLFMPICAGQRIGIFAGSGVGKSTLARHDRRLEGLRQRRDRARRRARPRSARIPRRLPRAQPQSRGHRRRDGRREPDDAPPGAQDSA